MAGIRKKFSNEFRAKVALEALKGQKTTAEISSEFGVHVSQISAWRNTLKEHVADAFSGGTNRQLDEKEALIERLYKNIGQLQVELDWFKKKFNT